MEYVSRNVSAEETVHHEVSKVRIGPGQLGLLLVNHAARKLQPYTFKIQRVRFTDLSAHSLSFSLNAGVCRLADRNSFNLFLF